MKSLIILMVLGLLAAGCTKKDEERSTATVENSQRTRPLYYFSDKGNKNASVNLEKGKVNVTYTHKGDGEFVVWLTSTDNSDSHLIAKEKGPKSEMVTVEIPKNGTYMLSIETLGSYIVSIR